MTTPNSPAETLPAGESAGGLEAVGADVVDVLVVLVTMAAVVVADLEEVLDAELENPDSDPVRIVLSSPTSAVDVAVALVRVVVISIVVVISVLIVTASSNPSSA